MTIPTLVPEDKRLDFLPGLFGPGLMIQGEAFTFGFASQLSKDYGGGMWNFYTLDGTPLFMAPADSKRFRMFVEGNGYEGEVSADAFGIICTMFALSHMSFRFESEKLSEGYVRLYEFASEHPEASAIFQAID